MAKSSMKYSQLSNKLKDMLNTSLLQKLPGADSIGVMVVLESLCKMEMNISGNEELTELIRSLLLKYKEQFNYLTPRQR